MLPEKPRPHGAVSLNVGTSQPRVKRQKQFRGENHQTWSQKTCILARLALPSCATSVKSRRFSEPQCSPLASGENNNATLKLCVPGAWNRAWYTLGAQ